MQQSTVLSASKRTIYNSHANCIPYKRSHTPPRDTVKWKGPGNFFLFHRHASLKWHQKKCPLNCVVLRNKDQLIAHNHVLCSMCCFLEQATASRGQQRNNYWIFKCTTWATTRGEINETLWSFYRAFTRLMVPSLSLSLSLPGVVDGDSGGHFLVTRANVAVQVLINFSTINLILSGLGETSPFTLALYSQSMAISHKM